MAEIDHTNNSIQRELRDCSLAAWGLEENVYAAGMVPSKSSKRSTGTYWKYDKRYFMSTQVQTRTAGSATPTAKYEAATATYSIGQKHLGVPITNEEIVDASDELDPFRDASTFLGNNFLVDYELDFANTFVVDDAWGYQAVGQAGAAAGHINGDPTELIAGTPAQFQQFDVAASDPLAILLKAIRTIQLETGLRPNKLMIPRLVMDSLRDNPNVVQWSASLDGITGGDEITKAIVAQHLGLKMDGIHVIEMPYQAISSISPANRAVQDHNFGQHLTPTFGVMEWVLEKSCLLMYTAPAFNKYSKTSSVCFKWDGLTNSLQNSDRSLSSGSGIDTPNLLIRSRYDAVNFTHYVEGYFAYENAIVAPNLGFYLKDCIA